MITQTVCWVARCDFCAHELDDGYGEQHFPTREAATRALDPLRVTATVDAEGNIECDECHQKRRCRAGNHWWSPLWHPIDETTVARACLNCSVTDSRARTQVDPGHVRPAGLLRLGGEPR